MKNLSRYQILASLPLLVLLAGGLYFQRLVIFAVNTNFVLNAIILGVMLIGVVIMHQQIWSIRRQSRKAGKFVQRVQQGEKIRDVLNDTELGTSDIGLVCDHLTHPNESVGGRPVEVVEAGLRSLHVTLNSRQELAQFLIGFLVALGLMGTFIGILETLIEISNMIGGFATADMQDLDKSFMALISDLTKPLKGMGTAFSASMFGLMGSLCLGLTMVSVRRCTEEFLTDLRYAINQLIKDRRSGHQEKSVSAGVPDRRADDLIRHQREAKTLFHQGLEAQVRLMQKMDLLEQRLLELGTMMLKQVEGAAETNTLLRASSVPRQTAEQFMGQIKVLATTASENGTNLAALLPALTGVTQKLGGFSETLLQQREQMQQTMLSSTESQGLIRNALNALVEEESEIHSGMLNEITQLRKFMLDMQPVSSQMVPLLTEINSRLNEQSLASNDQQETIRLMTQAVTQTFGGLKAGFAEMLQEAEKNRQFQADMSGQLMNSQLAAAEFSNLQQSLVKVADVLANSVTTSQVLVEEMRNMREAVAGDMRFEMQQALREHDAERANSSEETRANKAKS
jgi:hypothetical protein